MLRALAKGAAVLDQTAVERREIVFEEQHFPAHDQPARYRQIVAGDGDAQRNGAHGAHVRRHVIADLAVAARGTLSQHAVEVGQHDRQPVELRLDHVIERGVFRQQAPDALAPSL